jgi:septum formation protein
MMSTENPIASFILASASPRRRQLLALTGWKVIVKPVAVDEAPQPGESAEAIARRLALAKLRAAALNKDKNELILAADTIVVDGDRLLGKPTDSKDAERMLISLRGRSHSVHTAIALTKMCSGCEEIDICKTMVPMRDYSNKEIEAYIASGEPLDKAGSYGIQDEGFHPVEVERFNDCYANVMGLPLCHVVRAMYRLGYPLSVDVPEACQEFTGYTCTVHHAILRN